MAEPCCEARRINSCQRFGPGIVPECAFIVRRDLRGTVQGQSRYITHVNVEDFVYMLHHK